MAESVRGAGAASRRQLIIAELQQGSGPVHVEELSRRFNVSVATIRRDLDRLLREGRITRTYGGAVFGNVHAEQSLRQREVSNAQQKDAIARTAAGFVQPGGTVLLDAGTTTGRLAWYLREICGITVFTNGLNALVTLAEGDFDGEVVSLGGQLRRTNQAFSGSAAESVVRGVYADVAFLGADCVHHERGISSRTLEQSTLKGLMALHARHTVVLADSSKIGRDWGSYWSALDSPYSLVTDSHAPREALEPFLAREQVDVHVSEVDGPLG